MARVVTCFLRRGGEVLLVRRSESVGTYAGLWGGVSGYVERPPEGEADGAGDPPALADARREIREEMGLADAAFVRAGDPIDVRDGDRRWTVHPFLFDAPGGAVEPNAEIAAREWVQPPAMRNRETVPGLWAAYERAAPTVETVRADGEHGSAYVSLRALEVLRDGAATADDWAAVAELARALRTARPSMAAVGNRVNRAMAAADRDPASVRDRAAEAVTAAAAADRDAAAVAAGTLSDAGVGAAITLSRSGTAIDALLRARPAVVVAESRPGGEGRAVAAELAREGLDATLTTDAAVAGALAGLGGAPGDEAAPPDVDVDAAVVGADTVLADGDVVNKVGTRGLALAAAREGVPLYVVAARDKIAPHARFRPERADDADLRPDADADSAPTLSNPLFDRTPADLVTAVLTEEGALDPADARAVAAEHRDAVAWDEE